jgi:hypothetical protein
MAHLPSSNEPYVKILPRNKHNVSRTESEHVWDCPDLLFGSGWLGEYIDVEETLILYPQHAKSINLHNDLSQTRVTNLGTLNSLSQKEPGINPTSPLSTAYVESCESVAVIPRKERRELYIKKYERTRDQGDTSPHSRDRCDDAQGSKSSYLRSRKSVDLLKDLSKSRRTSSSKPYSPFIKELDIRFLISPMDLKLKLLASSGLPGEHNDAQDMKIAAPRYVKSMSLLKDFSNLEEISLTVVYSPLSKESKIDPTCSLPSIHVQSSEFIGVILNDEFVEVAREFLQVIL